LALGRGLGELLGETKIAYEASNGDDMPRVINVDISLIKSNPYQPRKDFNKEKLQELSNSIEKHGLLQPIVITRDADKYILIAGERRLKASKMANIDTINATILDVENSKLRELAIIENIHRDDLNIIELAYCYAQLINEHKITHEQLAQMVSKNRSSITNILRLLTLSVDTQESLSLGKITTGHARSLIGFDEKTQKNIIKVIIKEKLNVRQVEQLVKNIKQQKSTKIQKNTKNTKKQVNLKPIKNFINNLTKQNLKVKTSNNYIKIEFANDEDVNKFLKFFTN
jgi:ParB family chromosome partitioning protein